MGANKSKSSKLSESNTIRLYLYELHNDDPQTLIKLNVDDTNINDVFIYHPGYPFTLKQSLIETLSHYHFPKITEFALKKLIKIDPKFVKNIIMMYDIHIIKLLEKNYNLNLIDYTRLVFQNNMHIDTNIHFINMNPVISKSFFEDIIQKFSRGSNNRQKITYVISLMILKGYNMSTDDLNMIIDADLKSSMVPLNKYETIYESAKIYVRDNTCQICQARYIHHMEKECDECKNMSVVSELRNKIIE